MQNQTPVDKVAALAEKIPALLEQVRGLIQNVPALVQKGKGLAAERPEVAVGAAFAGAFLLAKVLRRLAR